MSRVIHGPINYANQAVLSARGLREVGVDARSVVTAEGGGFAYRGADVVLPPRRTRRTLTVLSELLRCDVLHLYSGHSLFPGRLSRADARLLRRRGRRVVMEFAGTDARLPSVASVKSPHYVAPETYDEQAINACLADWASLCSGHVIVADHNLDTELRRHFESIHVVGLRVDTRAFVPCAPTLDPHRLVLVHAPSDPRIKGTVYVRRAAEALRADGLDFEYVEINGMRHDEALFHYQRADIVVDQLCIGAHGVLALEAMSLAKPVMCYIRPDLVGIYPPDLPIINVNPDTLYEELGDWFGRPSDRRDLGAASRSYVEREHDIRVVAARLLDAYERLPHAT